MIAAQPVDALRLIDQGARDGIAGVLITLVGIERSASRAIGTQMAVLADGRHVGSFSGGCIETAIIAEAIEVLNSGLLAPRALWHRIALYRCAPALWRRHRPVVYPAVPIAPRWPMCWPG